MKINSQHFDARKQFDNLLINYTKGSYDVDIEEITRLAIENEFDIYADLTPENYRIYFEHLLNGTKNEDHYGELATYLYDRGYLDEAIDYLNVGIARLGAEKVSEFIRYLKEEFWIGKIYFGGNPHLTDQIRKAARGDLDILIEGETGTGKELATDLIHNLSSRHKKPLIKFSFAEIPSNLVESELFGHAEGYFTDAKLKKGLLEEAEDGDIFLDEINELDPIIQVKLNRVLQQRKFRLLGTSKFIDLKARIIFGTNVLSKELVASGKMRKDFFIVFPSSPSHSHRSLEEDIMISKGS